MILFPALLYGLLQSQYVQNFLVQHIANHFSKELETEISVGKVNFRLFRTLVLSDVELYDQQGVLMLEAPEFMVNIGDISFRDRTMLIRKLKLGHTYVNIYRQKDDPDYNFQFIVEYFSRQTPRVTSRKPWQISIASFELVRAGIVHNDYHMDVSDGRLHHARLKVDEVYLAMRDFSVSDSVLVFELDYLQGKESGGFNMNYLSGSFQIGRTETIARNMLLWMDQTNLSMDLDLSYETGLIKQNEGISLSGFQAFFRPSVVDLTQVKYLLPQLQGLSGNMQLEGELVGDAQSIHGNHIVVEYGNHTSFRGSFELEEYTSIRDMHGQILLDAFVTSARDLESFTLPGKESPLYINIPAEAYRLGKLMVNGSLAGNIDQLELAGDLRTDIGRMHARFNFHNLPEDNMYQYRGELETIGFNAGYFSASDKLLGKVDMHMHIDGRGTSLDDLYMDILGKVHHIDVLGYEYRNVDFEGQYSEGQLRSFFVVDDPNLYLDFRGVAELQTETPVFDVRIDIDRADLTKLNIFQRDSLFSSHLSIALDIKLQGSTLNDLAGEIKMGDVRYGETALYTERPDSLQLLFQTDSIYINSEAWGEHTRHVRFRSDFLDADLHGSIFYDQLINSMALYSGSYLPSLFTNGSFTDNGYGLQQDVTFSFRMKNTEVLTSLFFPFISISEGAWVNGLFSTNDNLFEIQSEADWMTFSGYRFKDWQASAKPFDDKFILQINSNKFLLTDSLHLDQLQLHTTIGSDSVNVSLLWSDTTLDNGSHGQVNGLLRIFSPRYAIFNFHESKASVNGDSWIIDTENQIILDSARIEVHQLMVYHEDQFMEIDGVFSTDPTDMMTLSFSRFDMVYSDILMGHRNFEFRGLMDGYLDFKGIFQPFSIGASLYIEDFSFNSTRLGDFSLQSIWEREAGLFNVEGMIVDHTDEHQNTPLRISGRLYPGGQADFFDLDFDLHDMPLEVWTTYMRGFASEFRGNGTGDLHLGGTLQNPELTGLVSASGSGFFIPYLNNSFSFTHDVEFFGDYFGFEDMALYDTLGNSAKVSGRIMHQAFKDFALDIWLQPDRMLIFNTTSRHNNMFYGQAFVSGMAHIHGPVNNITMDISARTNRGTRIFLPLNYSGDVRENTFISFVSKAEELQFPVFVAMDMPGGVAVNFDLEVTPEAEVQLMFDSQFGDIIRSRGAGSLRLEATPQGAFNIYGDYNIEDGEYFFNLQNIINKRFRIAQGSQIRWSGDLNDADVELEASYRLRTPLYDLVASEGMAPDMIEAYRRRTQVETILILEDKLFNPLISFDIRVPGGDETTRDLIERVITTEQEMNRQVFSLLVINRFMPTTTDQYNTALGFGVGNTSSELLSNQLSNWLTQISSDFDIGVNYRPGDEITSQEVELALSTQLFDDRVTIDGNFGVAGNQTATGYSTQGASQIIGDVNVEVKITPEGKFRVKAFNRSNTFDIINTNAPYTQGIGVFYRREFDSLEELFRRSVRSE